jgi:multidrug resistance protein, MATE family
MQSEQIPSSSAPFAHLIRRVLGLALPMAWSRFIQMAGWFVGMMMVAHLGKNVLAASALINATQITICVVFMSTLFSLGVISGRLYGEKKFRETGALLQQGFLLSVILGVCMMLVFFFVGPFLKLTDQSPALVNIANAYFTLFAWASMPMMLMVSVQQFCYGILKQRLVIINNLISLAVFIPITYLFIYGGLGIKPMGVNGLAAGIIVQTIVNLITLLFFLYFGANIKQFHLFSRHSHKGLRYIKQLFSVGWPMSVQFGGELLAFFVLTIFTGWIGTAALAATQVVQQVILLFLVPLFAVSEAAGILVSQSIGAKQFHEVKRTGNVCVLLGVIVVIVLSSLFFTIPNDLTAMYVQIDNPANAYTVMLARYLFYISSIMLLLDTMRNLYAGALRGFYDTRFPMWVGLITLWFIVVPVGYIVGFWLHGGVVGLRVGSVVGFAIGAWFLWRRWKNKPIQSHR